MRPCSQPILTVLVLVLWFVAGPLAMLVAGCAVMGAECQGPCAVTPALLPPVGGMVRFVPSSPAHVGSMAHAGLLLPAGLEPPPKSVLLV